MPYFLRYQSNSRGAITFTGNTLGLSALTPVPGTQGALDGITTFITTNTSLQEPGFPPGTTDIIDLNSSSAVLDLPIGSQVLYAELIWSGTYVVNGQDFSDRIDDAVVFSSPVGTVQVSPDINTQSELVLISNVNPQVLVYIRSADVTSIVIQGGGGLYTTGNVTGTTTENQPVATNAVGWTLAVVYSTPSLPIRNLTFFVANELVSTSGATETTAAITGFATPPIAPVNGRLMVSGLEGDVTLVGDQLLFGSSASTLTPLSGPNNFVNNFFNSQINGDNGLLDTRGTFGNLNSINGSPGTTLPGVRQGYTITNVSVSNLLPVNVTSALVRAVTRGDSYVINALGLQIDAVAPEITAVKSVDLPQVFFNETVVFTVQIQNVGALDTIETIFIDELPQGTQFVAGSLQVNGVTQPNADPLAGVVIPLTISSPVTVTFAARIVPTSSLNLSTREIVNQADIQYSYIPFVGSPPITGTSSSNPVIVSVFEGQLTLQKTVDKVETLLNDILTFTLRITNTGNATATQIVLTDVLSSNLQLIPGSTQTLGASITPLPNIINSIQLGNLQPTQSTSVSFQARVISVPDNRQIPNQFSAVFNPITPNGRVGGQLPAQSNIVIVTVFLSSLTVRKFAGANEITTGNTLLYTIVVTNSGEIPAIGAVLIDSTVNGFIEGSVTVNGVDDPQESPLTGISLPAIPVGGTVAVTYQVLPDAETLPATIRDVVTVNGVFQTPGGTRAPLAVQSNEAVFTLRGNPAVIQIIVNPPAVVVNEIVTINVTISSQILINIFNLIVNVPLPPILQFIQGTLIINGQVATIQQIIAGIRLGQLDPNQSISLRFQVRVLDVPANNSLPLVANGRFNTVAGLLRREHDIISNRELLTVEDDEE
ncbi:hypothetical protein SY83_21485 [Paenibacillus swuensis]|uniref:DUF11 domain-containing protein n=1 Tax=Paenibacillus swuensis TaxID=1178515 RepID=A0A172TN77_9BACL|nr:DUF11 domain-containing protein [Paenibacillus swuensis]ANE48426.1 hypothetical protein SY83_21485 [Paenibacillus swuensis]